MTSINLAGLDLWFKVFHEEFDPKRVYRAIAIMEYGETAWSQILFATENGMMYSVVNYKCRCINPEAWSKPGDQGILTLSLCKPKGRNSAIGEIDSINEAQDL